MSETRREILTPDPNECNSTLTNGTKNIYPYPYIDVNDWGHWLRIIHRLHRTALLWVIGKENIRRNKALLGLGHQSRHSVSVLSTEGRSLPPKVFPENKIKRYFKY